MQAGVFIVQTEKERREDHAVLVDVPLERIFFISGQLNAIIDPSVWSVGGP